MNKKLEPRTEIVQFRVSKREREDLIRQARGGNLSPLIRAKLGFNE